VAHICPQLANVGLAKGSQHSVKNVARYANTPKAPLVHGLRALHDEHAPLSFKQPRYGLPGKAGKRGHFSHGVCPL
jgi:hypothetical protein